MRWSLGLILVLLVVGCGSAAVPPAAPPALSYVERVVGNGKAEGALPLLIAVHGLGDTPEDFLPLFDGFDVPLRVVAPRAPDPHSVGTSWFPIDDGKRAAAGTITSAERLAALADQLRERHRVRGLPLVTGFSQGGILSFALAAYHSERFHAALPIAGFLHPLLPALKRARAGFRVTALHGRDDDRIPYADDEATIERLRAVGTEASLTGFVGVGHTVSLEMRQRLFAALRSELARL